MYSVFFMYSLISLFTLQNVAGIIYGTLPAHTLRQLSTDRGCAIFTDKTKNHQDNNGGAKGRMYEVKGEY